MRRVMTEFQDAKALVRRHYAALDAAAPGAETEAALAAATTPDWAWHGYHPFGLLSGAEAVAQQFWSPLKSSLTSLQRRDDLFFAGRNDCDGFETVWVAGMGHLMGLFDHPWLGIRPTGKLAFLRYATFHRIEGDRIAQTAMYFDVPSVMMQAGLQPFPPQTGGCCSGIMIPLRPPKL